MTRCVLFYPGASCLPKGVIVKSSLDAFWGRLRVLACSHPTLFYNLPRSAAMIFAVQ